MFVSFITSTQDLSNDVFINKRNNRFNIALFESTFVASGKDAFERSELITQNLDEDKIYEIDKDEEFSKATQSDTTSTINVKKRLQIAYGILHS